VSNWLTVPLFLLAWPVALLTDYLPLTLAWVFHLGAGRRDIASSPRLLRWRPNASIGAGQSRLEEISDLCDRLGGTQIAEAHLYAQRFERDAPLGRGLRQARRQRPLIARRERGPQGLVQLRAVQRAMTGDRT
jgi:hypothetical protein